MNTFASHGDCIVIGGGWMTGQSDTHNQALVSGKDKRPWALIWLQQWHSACLVSLGTQWWPTLCASWSWSFLVFCTPNLLVIWSTYELWATCVCITKIPFAWVTWFTCLTWLLAENGASIFFFSLSNFTPNFPRLHFPFETGNLSTPTLCESF